MWLGLQVPFGRSALLLSFNEARTDYGSARQYALGWTSALSKRANLVASYARIGKDPHTAFAVGSATDWFVGSPGQDSSGFAFGMRQGF